MRVTARELNRATLGRQSLLARAPLGVVEAVRRVAAVQAQEPASPYIALWNRVAGFDPADLDRAFTERRVVKASLLRIALHAVLAEDYPAFHRAMASSLRGARLGDRRFTDAGLSAAEVDALLAPLAEFTAVPRTVPEIEELLAARLGRREPRAWWALRTYAPLHHAPVGGPWSFRPRASFLAADPAQAPASPDEAVQWTLLRYLQAFGPASAQDFAQFTLLRRPVVRRAAEALGGRLERLEGPDGAELLDVPGAPRPDGDAVAPPRLLPMWDSVLLAHADRSRVIPPDHRPVVVRRNGDVLPTLLVDGLVAGVWRPVEAGIEATALRRLDDGAWEALAAEAAALLAFLADRQPDVYRRYTHWWTKGLPAAEVRTLPA